MSRGVLKRRLEGYVRKHGYPRLQMTLTVLATALCGFVFSVLLFRAGVDVLWIRYAVALVLAYGVFLLLLALRVRTRSKVEVDPFSVIDSTPGSGEGSLDISKASAEFGAGGGHFGGGGASAHFEMAAPPGGIVDTAGTTDSAAGGADVATSLFEESAAIAIAAALFAALAGLCVSIYMIYIAPSLYAELLLDGAVSAALLRRLKTHDQRHWAKTAFKRTWFSVLLMLLSFGFAGWAIPHVTPEAKTLGQFIHHLWG